MKNIIIAAMLTALVLSACKGVADVPAEEITFAGDTVKVNSESSILSRLEIGTINLEPFSNEFRTVGTVQAENGHYAEVGLPFDGRIVRSFVSLGSKVRAGQALFEVSSPEFMETSKEYFQNLRIYEKAKAEYQRQKELMEFGITSQKELDEAYVEAENARQDLEFSEATLKVYGTDPSNAVLGQSMKIIAPVSGEVVRNTITMGSYVKADSDPLITIADLGKVWVTALVKERFISSVSINGRAEIITEAENGTSFEGKIIHVGNLVDEETRSVQVVISCDNKDLVLKHGMYVSVHFLSEARDMIVLPSTAVFQGETKDYVYVCTDKENVFVKREIETGSASDDNKLVSIIGGLGVGEKVISKGGLYLNN